MIKISNVLTVGSDILFCSFYDHRDSPKEKTIRFFYESKKGYSFRASSGISSDFQNKEYHMEIVKAIFESNYRLKVISNGFLYLKDEGR